MLDINPKLSGEEIKMLRKHIDRRRGMVLTAEATGLSRHTVRSVMNSGMCSEDTAKKIRKFLKSQSVEA